LERVRVYAVLVAGAAVLVCGCHNPGRPSPRNPVSLSFWHTHTRPPETTLRELVEEFNATAGAREGIFVAAGTMADQAILDEKLLVAAEGDPGAPELPDIAVVYPAIAQALVRRGLLMDFASQFSAAELARYVDRYVQEGVLEGALYLLPFAKSTEVVFLNKTIFDRFAADVPGVTLRDLETFEGILGAAEKYYRWSGGKAFFFPDDLLHYALIGMEQLGDPLMRDGRLNLRSPAFRRIWDAYYGSAVRGESALFNNFGNYLAMTGDVICVTSSTASAAYFPPSVTYRDNTREAVEFIALPYPVFAGGEKVAIQRGGGVCVIKSSPAREYGAGVFLKWLTAAEQNRRFASSAGYMPVTKQAVEEAMAAGPETGQDLARRTLQTMLAMAGEYRFFVPPVFEGFYELRNRYIEALQKTIRSAREEPMQTEAPDGEAQSLRDLALFIALAGGP
jgi:multiple sugar transport system substrate-binding protein